MPTQNRRASSIRFSDCEIDALARRLRRGGSEIAVQPRVFDLLLHLALNPSRTVSRKELFAEVWNGLRVREAALNQAMMQARRAIGDDGRRQALIRTVRGRGYQLVAEVAPRAGESIGAGGQQRRMGTAPRRETPPTRVRFGASIAEWRLRQALRNAEALGQERAALRLRGQLHRLLGGSGRRCIGGAPAGAAT